MRPIKKIELIMLMTLLFTFIIPCLTFAGGFLVVSNANQPYKWNTAQFPIKYHVDQGKCGALSNAAMTQLVQDNITKWTTSNIPYSSVQFSSGGSLTSDITTAAQFEQVRLAQDGKNPIVYDVDGSIIADLGMEPGVIGFASPVYVTSNGFIVKGVAVFNGNFLDGDTQDGYELNTTEFGAIILHEFGHFLNLDHTQINGQYYINDSDPGFQLYGNPPVSSISIMFPFALGLGEPVVPQSDDIRAIANLYPTAAYTSETRTISGRILLSDGVTPLTGANIIARNNADPFIDVASYISGALTSDDPNDPAIAGYYTISGLTAGANYTIEVVNINSEFISSSSIGPLDTPIVLSSPEEFYNGDGENNDGLADDTNAWSLVPAGSANIDIILNSALTAVEESSSPSLQRPRSIELFSNYPNPFNPETKISFETGQSQFIRLAIFNVRGRQIRILLDQQMPAGRFSVAWNGRDTAGKEVAGGIYFYKITTARQNLSRKMLLLR